MTTVFFLRHGPTQENKEQRIQGHQGGTLLHPETESYITAVIPILRAKKPSALICSDLERAVHTCRILKEKLEIEGIKESVDPLLREAAKGFYEGMAWEDVPEQIRGQRGQLMYDFRQFGGESDGDVRTRVTAMLRRLAQLYPNQHVVCITHAGWIRQLVYLTDKTKTTSPIVDRSAIYEVGLKAIGEISYIRPILLAS